MGSPVCRSCGQHGEYDGWYYTTHEAMARYQSRYGLKPIGPHRQMADDLFADTTVECEQCQGRGLRDIGAGETYAVCQRCGGFGRFFSRSREAIHRLRQKVLDAYPDAAADFVPDIAAAPLAFSFGGGQIVNLASEQDDDPQDADEDRVEPEISASPEGDPWRDITVADGVAVLEQRLILTSSTTSGGCIFKPADGLSIASVLLQLAPEAEDAFDSETPAEIFARVMRVTPTAVVRCSVSDSMVSGSWGLFEVHLGSRGYLYYEPDWGVGDDESLPILGAWAPADDLEARRQLILEVYASEWDKRALPPMMGQWASGEPALLQAAVSRVLKEHPDAWRLVFQRLRDCRELAKMSSATITDVAERSGAEPTFVRTVIDAVVNRRDRLVSERATNTKAEAARIVVALFLHCIADDPFLRPPRRSEDM